jgi:hypothetical protein
VSQIAETKNEEEEEEMEEKDLRRGREGKGGGGDLRKEGSLILDMFDYRCKRKNQIQMIY